MLMAEPIRVAQVVGKMVGGGVEQVVMNYYRHIDRSRVQFDFIVDEDSTLVPREEIESLGGRVFTVPPYQHVLAYQKALVKLFREQSWEIVHSHINALSVFPLHAARRAGVPVRIAHSHSTSGGHDLVKNTIKEFLRPLANIYPTHRAACSRHAGEWLFGEGVDFTVIPNAIDLDSFWFNPQRRACVREALGFPAGQLVVGHIGRFTPQKNQSFLVRVFSLVVTKRPDVRLVLVGEGRQKKEVEALAESICPEGSVLFLGQREDVADLYQAFDVFCLPSEFEGLGMVAVEAEASGLPCVLSDAVPGDADPVGAAVFLPTNDEKAWSEAIENLRLDSRIAVEASAFKDFSIADAAILLCDWYIAIVKSSLEGKEC